MFHVKHVRVRAMFHVKHAYGRAGPPRATMGRMRTRALSLLAAALCLAACAPVVSQHGTAPSYADLEALAPGVDGPDEVLAKLGPPTARSALGGRRWFYMHYTMKQRGIRDAAPRDERVLIIAFSPDWVLEGAEVVEPERVRIPLDSTVTPARGTERSLWQEFFGNIGRFRPAGAPGGGGPGV
jgi:outer membrane protein assembly factor BamE (lipoprotein component of BamABCDE complex)